MSTSLRIPRLLLAALCFLLLTTSTLDSQTYTGTIDGLVSDPSGSPVPDATVTITNNATKETRSVASSVDGRYAFAQMNPGTYSVQIAKSGFRNFDVAEVVLTASQTREISATLQIGDAKQTVNVTEAAQQIDAENTNQSVTLNTQLVQELPTQARNPLVLFNTQAGAVAPRTGASTSDNDENQNRFSINGSRDEQVLVLIDGVPDAAGDWGGALATPGVDSVQEFQIVRNAYDARYSRTAGGVVNIITRGGSQQYHATAFEYLQNNVLNANDFFNNRNNIKRAVYNRNDFGGNIGGPIIKKFRLFGFYGAEFLRQTRPNTLITTLPTALERSGNFSQTFNSNGTQVQIYNPFSTTLNPATGAYSRTAFAGDQIPASLLSPVALKVLSLLPSPNVPGTGAANANNYAVQQFSRSEFNRYDGRVDWVVSDNVSVFGSFTKAPQSTTPKDVLNPLIDNTTYTNEPRWHTALGATWTVDPTTVLTFLVGAGKFSQVSNSIGYGMSGAALGFSNSFVSSLDVPTPPAFSLSGYYSPGNSTVSVAARSMVDYGVYGSKQFSTHLLQFGWYVNRYYLSLIQTNSANFTFNRFFTDGPTPVLSGSPLTGNSIASFLLGTGASGDVPLNAQPTSDQTHWNAFIQDSWKIGRNLTINAGLAWELQRPRTERYNRLNWFDPTAASPLAQATGLTNLKGGLDFVSSSNPYQWTAPEIDFAPRIGIAYKIRDNLVFRGGYGIYYTPTIAVGPLGNTGYSVDNTWQSTLNGGLTPYNLLDNPFPTGLAQPTGSAAGLATGVGQNITTVFRNRSTPYAQQFSGEFEYQVKGGLLIDLGYSGSQGRKLLYGYGGFYNGVNINQVPDADLSLGSALNSSVANPFYGTVKTGILSQPTVLLSQLLRPYPQFLNVNILQPNGASSSFNAGTLRVTDRLGKSLTLIATYQRSKAIDNASEDQGWEVGDQFRDVYNLSLERSISAHDVPNSFATSFVYEVPVGKGRKYGANMHPAVAAVVGGWQVSGIWTIASGLPLIFSAPVNEFNDTAWQFPNINSGASVTVSNRTIAQWFNISAFSQPAPYTYGNAPRYIGAIRYQGTDNLNVSVGKNFRLWSESSKLQVRAEMYNSLNRVQFGRADTNITDQAFGQVSSEAPGTGPRIIQLGARLQF